MYNGNQWKVNVKETNDTILQNHIKKALRVTKMSKKNKSAEFRNDCIADALLQLMEEKPIEKITAQEITDLAGVGRF